MKTGKCSLKRGIIAVDFGEKCASLLPILEKAWWTRGTSFIEERRSLYQHSPDGTAIEWTHRCYGE